MSKIVSEKQIVDEMLEKIPESPIKQQLREKIVRDNNIYIYIYIYIYRKPYTSGR